jgi:hypothetical protein
MVPILLRAPEWPDRTSDYVDLVAVSMYDEGVKTVTITIPESLDAQAAAEARRRGISKSELIRLGLASVLPASQSVDSDDPWRDLAGFGEASLNVGPGEIDSTLYGS